MNICIEEKKRNLKRILLNLYKIAMLMASLRHSDSKHVYIRDAFH